MERRDILEDRLKGIEDNINTQRPNDELRFKVLKDQVLNLQNTLEEERASREVLRIRIMMRELFLNRLYKQVFDERKTKETKTLDENLHNLLEEEKTVKYWVS